MTDGAAPAQSANFRRKSAALHQRERAVTLSTGHTATPSALNAAEATNGAAAAAAAAKRKRFFSLSRG